MKKSIVFFHPTAELYGADKILASVINNYKDYKKTIVVKSDGPLLKIVKSQSPDIVVVVEENLPIIAKKNLTLLGIFTFLVSLIKFERTSKSLFKNGVSIVYLNTLATLPVLFFCSKSTRKIVHVHEILSNSNILNKLLNKVAIKYSDAVICVSEAVKRNLASALPSMIDKLLLIQNGVEFVDKQKDGSKNYFNTEKINFGLIGRIKPSHKGQIHLLNAINKLPKDILQQGHFYFVGSTVPGQEYMLDEVKDKIREYKLSNSVTIIPFVEEIQVIYRNLDVVIVPSVFEDPFPTTVLEGMFFSKPIIGNRVGGIPEMIVENETGFLCERNDIEALSRSIQYFIENPKEIRSYGEKGKARFNHYFTLEKFNIRYKEGLSKFL